MTSAVSRRIEKSINHLREQDAENCLIHLFPAIDIVSKKRRPGEGVGARIKGFLADEEGLITGIATGSVWAGSRFNGMTFPEAIYKYGRTSIVHDGELDERLEFSDDGNITIGDTWALNLDYIFAMILAVVVAPENIGVMPKSW